ncbi:MAG TPA: O-antigen ligase family protein [Blastocatellia bacterium]|nr:O-antigen ligase family protein [Blastocatellia bacterium]
MKSDKLSTQHSALSTSASTRLTYQHTALNPHSELRTQNSELKTSLLAGFFALVVFTALALGTVEAWSVAIFELGTLALLLRWGVSAWRQGTIEVRLPRTVLPLAGFLVLGLIQSVAVGSGGHRMSLSRDVEATRAAVVVIFFLIAMFVVASNLFPTGERLRALAVFLIAYGFILAVFAIVQHLTWDGKLFWIRPVKSASGFGGPFVNRNHFAGYMEMLVPVSLAMALSRSLKSEQRLLCGFAAIMMSISIAASLSRGGMVSLAASLVFMAVSSIWLARARGRRSSRIASVGQVGLFVSLVLACVLAGVYWVGADSGIAERIAGKDGALATSRHVIWSDTAKMVLANPITGVGLGAFETSFPLYSRSDGSQTVEYAHNDYLQALADGGVVAGALALWFVIVAGRAFVKAIKSHDERDRVLALGFGTGIFALLVHSLFDFNLQIPSNALMFLLLVAALGCVADRNRNLLAE